MSPLFHLSHTDLDGYGCQYLTTQVFDHISCFNANYGIEVSAQLQSIINTIKKEQINDALILITDLNLTIKEARWIEEEASLVGASLELLDHHASGQSCAERFGWYYLDTARSATQITYDWLVEKHGFDPKQNYLPTAQVINAVDIWLDEHPYFELGKVCLGMISSTRELNKIMFDQHDRAYKLYLIKQIESYYTKEQAHIALDDDLHQIKKKFFIHDQNDTKDNLVAAYTVDLISKQREHFTIYYKDKKGVLVYNVGNSSIIGNKFLIENRDYDFYMDIGGRGKFSLRSSNRADVSKIAQVLGNGGGHPNASGGKIENFKSSFIYEEVKKFVEEHIAVATA